MLYSTARVSRRPVVNPWERELYEEDSSLAVAPARAAGVGRCVLAGCGDEEVPAGAIATVGDGVGHPGAVRPDLAQAKAQYASARTGAPPFPSAGTPQYNQLKASIVNYLVQNELIKQQGRRDGRHGHRQAARRAHRSRSSEQVGGQKKLDKLLKKQGVTQDAARGRSSRPRCSGRRAARRSTTDIKVTTESRSRSTTRTRQQVAVRRARDVDARHVLVKTKAEAEKVRALLEADNSDANWKKVAKKYSTDPGSKDNGGSLGNFPKGRMVEPFDKAAFALKVGEISRAGQDAVRLARHRGHQEDRRATQQTFEEAKATIEQRSSTRSRRPPGRSGSTRP